MSQDPRHDEHGLPPFKVQLADRMSRLPPYLFGRINALLYKKRRTGDDVIDLGMGNPSDPPQDLVIEKLVEAARSGQSRLQPVDGHSESAPGGGQQIPEEVRRAA